MREVGFSSNTKHTRATILPHPEMNAKVTYLFDSIIRRSATKVAFNYLAHAIGEDTRLLLRADFDVVRNFIRDGVIPQEETVFIVGSPRLSEESRRGSLIDGHMIAVGWGPDERILCNLSIFNAMTYQVILCRRYEGLWFPLNSAHSFDLSTRKAKSLPSNILVPI
jgi:hypothetical protein